jgi:chromosome partitioning protein
MIEPAEQSNLHKIVVLNPKGGCGKTTLATNIASYYARQGAPPTLVDFDPQGFSMRWVEKRPDTLAPVHGVPAYESTNGSLANAAELAHKDSRILICDVPAALTQEQIHDVAYDAHSILIPVMPSEIDVYSASRFIAELLLVSQFDRRDGQLAVVANRTRVNTRSFKTLMRFLTSLKIPIVSVLRDSQNYVHAAANGIGIHDLPAHRASKDVFQMELIVNWLNLWRMRRLDAVTTSQYEHLPGAEILTPAPHKHVN